MSCSERMVELTRRIENLDEDLFSPVEAQLNRWDRRCLLALHAAVASMWSPFAYLEIGSYRGGSLQVLMCDPRCTHITSIDPRTAATPDSRAAGVYTYEENTTQLMLDLLAQLPSVDLDKLTTLESSTDRMSAYDLDRRPDFCFIDGEHSNDAALRDARFCAEAMRGRGVIAFHDYQLVEPAIRTFLREAWRDISHAIPLPGQVFALELGGTGVLRTPVMERAIGSRWHSRVWTLASKPAGSAAAFLGAWSAVPAVDKAVFEARRRLRRSKQAD